MFVSDVDEDLMCGICHEVMVEPKCCQQGHSFCRACESESPPSMQPSPPPAPPSSCARLPTPGWGEVLISPGAQEAPGTSTLALATSNSWLCRRQGTAWLTLPPPPPHCMRAPSPARHYQMDQGAQHDVPRRPEHADCCVPDAPAAGRKVDTLLLWAHSGMAAPLGLCQTSALMCHC